MNEPMRRRKKYVLSGLALSVFLLAFGNTRTANSGSARAGNSGNAKAAKLISQSGSWKAYSGVENGKKFCFIGSEPTKSTGKYTKRGDAYVLVTHRPAEGARSVVSVTAGYAYKPSSEAEITIGGQSFNLFTDGGAAWAYDAKADKAITRAMKAGLTMIVRGASARGTLTTDTYSLKGFTKAYNAIGKACKGK